MNKIFVLYYFHQDMDWSTVEVLAASSDRALLEKKKSDLLEPAKKYAKERKEFEDNAKKTIYEFFQRQKHALKDPGHPSHLEGRTEHWSGMHDNHVKNKQEKLIKECSERYYDFCGDKYQASRLKTVPLFLDKLTEPVPNVGEGPVPPNPCYGEDSWGGQGLRIAEVPILIE